MSRIGAAPAIGRSAAAVETGSLGASRAGNRAGNRDGGDLLEIFSMMGSVIPFERNAEIFAEEEPADYVYMVASGVVRTCRFLEDGRRQIGAFPVAGDIFGFETSALHGFAAEAVTNCRIVVIRRSSLIAAARRDAALASALWLAAAQELQRMQEHMVLLGRKCATERVMAFLAGIAERLGAERIVEIPMSRQDIADHLGLTIETVSRTMTQLQESGAIRLESARRIRLGACNG